ncbi:hypothetical protein DDE82_000551 [Stemphylium lycopersici]|nr:hypothetical protein TW65_00814 [Stemphylium lycopersici]RAR11605.1 hypothetical protein DDE82_000551 [Stemphylium lycopersici]
MSNTYSPTELGLQICFGIFGVLSTIATIASLHRHDSLGCVLLRHMMRGRVHHDGAHDDEVALRSLQDPDDPADGTMPSERRHTPPPSYEQSGEGSHSDTLIGSDIDVAILDNNKPNNP